MTPTPPCPERDSNGLLRSYVEDQLLDWWRARALELVDQYARHRAEDCELAQHIGDQRWDRKYACTCGLDELRAAIREAK